MSRLSVEKALIMGDLNEVIHQPARLQIMAILAAISPERQATFSFLKETCGLTDGNLGAHLRRLEEAGYVTIVKTFVRKKPLLVRHWNFPDLPSNLYSELSTCRRLECGLAPRNASSGDELRECT